MASKTGKRGKKKGYWARLDKDGDGMVIDDIMAKFGKALHFHRIHKSDIEDEWDDVINNTLASIRTLMPGVSVLLGFLLSIHFSTRFEGMALADQLIFYISFYLAALTLAFLLTPSIYYRIVHPFEDKEVFINFATKVLIIAMFPLAGSLMLVIYVTTKLVLPTEIPGREAVAIVFVGAFILLFIGVWTTSFVDRKKFYTLRRKKERAEKERAEKERQCQEREKREREKAEIESLIMEKEGLKKREVAAGGGEPSKDGEGK